MLEIKRPVDGDGWSCMQRAFQIGALGVKCLDRVGGVGEARLVRLVGFSLVGRIRVLSFSNVHDTTSLFSGLQLALTMSQRRSTRQWF